MQNEPTENENLGQHFLMTFFFTIAIVQLIAMLTQTVESRRNRQLMKHTENPQRLIKHAKVDPKPNDEADVAPNQPKSPK